MDWKRLNRWVDAAAVLACFGVLAALVVVFAIADWIARKAMQ